jgi:linoleoyl-CoA desaturase
LAAARAHDGATGEARLVFSGRGGFFKTVRARVDAHFGERSKTDDPRLLRQAMIILAWFVGSYTLLLFARSAWAQLILCISYTLAACALGFNLFHDANHGAFSSSRRVNLFLSRLTCVFLGPSRYLWWQKHHVYHHVFTNVFQWDDDIETRGFLRMSPRQPWERKFARQHLFFVPLYALSTIEWFFVKDFVQYFRLRMTHRPIPPFSPADKLEFWLSKAAYVGLFVVLPFAFIPAPRVLLGLLLFHVMFGLALTFIFQIAHGTEKVQFPEPQAGNPAQIEEEWAAHEMRTTVNFAVNNRLLNWFAGGLNFQVEHHLFPHMSHTYYPEISAIVQQTAAEYGLPYNLHDTYVDAVKSHFRFVRSLGVEPSPDVTPA